MSSRAFYRGVHRATLSMDMLSVDLSFPNFTCLVPKLTTFHHYSSSDDGPSTPREKQKTGDDLFASDLFKSLTRL